MIYSANALRAPHRVLICARFEASEGYDSKTLGDVMETAEYLVTILQDLEIRFSGYGGLVAMFDADLQAVTKQEQERAFAAANT